MRLTKALLHYLPVLVIVVGVLFIAVVIHEYQRSIALVDENQALISESAKVRLMANLVDSLPKIEGDSLVGNYSWVKKKPNYYQFKSGKQVFPWLRDSEVKEEGNKSKWHDIWSEVNNLSESKHLDQDRLSKLLAVKNALSENDETKISQTFADYMQHTKAFILSPIEEVAYSLKLVSLGIKEHWNKALIDAFLLTGGPEGKPIIRPVIGWLFEYDHLFSREEIDSIIEMIQISLEQVSLSSYFLTEYLHHFYDPEFHLSEDSESEFVIENNSWLVRRSDDQAMAIRVQLKSELDKVKANFLQLGSLQGEDTLFFVDDLNGALDVLKIGVNKSQLDDVRKSQFIYLIIKVLMLIAFVGLLIITLRMIEKNHRRRLEYINLKEDFVKLVGHELKTPLSGIRAMAETLQKRTQRGLDIQSYPERIVNESDKLWHMVDNILSFNRMQEGSFQLMNERVSLRKLCHSVAEQVAFTSEKKYQFNHSISENDFYKLDAELFSLVIKNILVNAGLYNVNEEIMIDFFIEEGAFKIQDNGIGINETNYHRVFEPFVRLPQSVRCSGTGIGLALCQRIVRLHGGEISIEHSNQAGTLWVISLKNDG